MGRGAPASPSALDELSRLAPALQSLTAARGALGLLSVPVDLVTRRGLRAELRQCIEDEAAPIAASTQGEYIRHTGGLV